MTTPYIDPNLIFAENAPVQDKPAAFENYDKGWDESRKNDGRPRIPQMNYLQQQADLKNRYIHENGAALPYKEGISYEENAVVVKDGVLQQLNDGVWKSVISDGLSNTIQTFNTPESGVDPVTGVADGSYYNVRSTEDDKFLVEYQNIGGVPTPSGKAYPSSDYVQTIAESTPLPFVLGESYNTNRRVQLNNGDIVKSTIEGNTNNPNLDMTGWVNTKAAQAIEDNSGKNQQEINDQSLYKDPADAIETLLSKSILKSSYVNNIDVSLTLTVGASGQFANLNSALEHATRLSFLYKKQGVWCDVLLLSGFIMDEQVLLNNTNLAHVRIKSQDPEVTIKRSALVLGQGSRFPAFGATNGAHLPFINAYFVMDETGTQAYRDGIYVSDNSLGVCHEGGVRNVGGRGLNVASGSMFDARNAVFKGAKEIGIRVSNASVCQARSCDFSNSYRGASINTGYACLSYSNMSDCGIGISADESSVLSFAYGIAERCTEQALLVDGASIFAKGATLNGSAIGIYAKNGANVNFESGKSTGGNKAIYAESGAYVSAVSSDLKNSSQIGAHITFGASAVLTSADITGCGIGISADRGANVSAYGADMTGAATACVISRAATVTLEAAKARRNANADSIADIQVSHGGIVRKTTGTTGGNSQPSNIVTNSGIIFDATVRPISGTTAARPTAGLYVGQQYFDTTLGKVIFVKDIAAPVWVDSAGTTV